MNCLKEKFSVRIVKKRNRTGGIALLAVTDFIEENLFIPSDAADD